MIKIEDYRDVAPQGTVDLLLKLAEKVRGRRFLHVSMTRYGGGVAEILQRLVPIMVDLGIEAGWEIIGGDAEFFSVTKAIHAALEGEDQIITDEMLQHYLEMNRLTALKLNLDADLVLVHDSPPASLVEHRPPEGTWVWRCHVDLSSPHRRIWNFFRRYVTRYDAAVFSLPKFSQKLGIPKFIIHPSIDPLSDKNRDLSRREVQTLLASLGVPQDKPLLLQVGPFDRYRDPIGIINAYRMVKKHHDVRLVLVGGGSAAGSENTDVHEVVRDTATHDPDIVLLDLPPDAHLQINALQRAATVVLQKSARDGFAIGIAEAMWKGKPVIGWASGGIPAQIIYDVTGYTVTSVEGAAFRLRHLLNNPELVARIGGAGREHVRRNFLITRHLSDYLALLVHLTGRST
ncbi:MAG TPA: glycosyltransferase [Methylomirabilota bacterium]|nr:glycosyltransferase [Methylomirabilota bacterium]